MLHLFEKCFQKRQKKFVRPFKIKLWILFLLFVMNKYLVVCVYICLLQHNDGILDSGSEALTCCFNRRGTLLAVGCNDGRIAVWDFMTRGIARICSEHIHPITSLRYNFTPQLAESHTAGGHTQVHSSFSCGFFYFIEGHLQA